jgi:hypothetical protein
MMSRERKKQQAAAAAHLQEKLKILRSITHSRAVIISIDHLCSSILELALHIFFSSSCFCFPNSFTFTHHGHNKHARS